MKNNSGGFTLVELVICMVIFSVVVAAAFGFMLSGAKSYNSVTERLNLQVKSQLTLSQLDNYITDSNAGIYFDGGKLYVFNKTDGSLKAHVFQFRDDCIYYGEGSATETASGKFECAVSPKDLLAEDVSDFSVASKSQDGLTVSSAEIHIVLGSGKASAEYEKIVALRNKPAIVISVQTT